MPARERWTPFRDLDRMEWRMGRFLSDVGFLPTTLPATDIYETGKEYVVELEVPGFDDKQLTIEVTDHALVVTGEREEETEKKARAMLLRERLERRFERRFEPPLASDSEHARAPTARACSRSTFRRRPSRRRARSRSRTSELDGATARPPPLRQTPAPSGKEAVPMKADAPVSRDELERIVHEYRHVREEYRRARSGGHTRRHLGAHLEQLSARFERLLAEAALDEAARRRWRDHLRHGIPEPDEPTGMAPLVFRGRSDAGSELRLLARPDGSIDALVDGASIERLDSADELTATAPGLTFRLEGVVFHETFRASPAARTALRESLETSGPPEPAIVGELLADGIVDRDLGLTPRGRRALALDTLPAHRSTGRSGTLSVNARGPLPKRARVELEGMLARVAHIASRSPLNTRGSLVQEEDPALERPILAKARLDLGGRVVRAQVAAATAAEAIDLLESRLRRKLLDLAEREEAARRGGRPSQPGQWRHGDLPTQRPAFFDRPPEERRLVRRKSFTAEPTAAAEAAWEMRLLEHDFHLFADTTSGEDALVYLRDDGVLGLKRIHGDGAHVERFRIDPDPAPTLSTEQAIERLNATQEPFLFFVEREPQRSAVLYRRYDGHYGLVTMRPLAA